MSDRSFEWSLTVVPSDGETLERNGTSGELDTLRADIANAVSDVIEDVEQMDMDAEGTESDDAVAAE